MILFYLLGGLALWGLFGCVALGMTGIVPPEDRNVACWMIMLWPLILWKAGHS